MQNFGKKIKKIFSSKNRKKNKEKKNNIINLIKNSDLFDEVWYKAQYKNLIPSDIEPAAHYYLFGAAEGKDPSPFFSGNDYYALNNDVALSGVNPLLHYLQHGRKENRPVRIRQSAVNNIANNKAVLPSKQSVSNTQNRIAVFAFYSPDHLIPDYVLYYLKELKKICNRIIFVADNSLDEHELKKLDSLVSKAICEKHGEYDFGSYKRGFLYAKQQGYLNNIDELIFCNDSCYGPVFGFADMVAQMSEKNCDFWGVTDNTEFAYHLQTYFLLFKKPVFTSQIFENFFKNIARLPSVREVVLQYETKMTEIFVNSGFKVACYINDKDPLIKSARLLNTNLVILPNTLVKAGCPLVKVKALKKVNCNFDGTSELLNTIYTKNRELYYNIVSHSKPHHLLSEDEVKFSIITPFFNRKHCILDAIYSVLNQTHQNFELLLVDDGSTDDACDLIKTTFKEHIETGKIKLFRSDQRRGVCHARNVGLENASSPWIAYLDSDNTLKPNFLISFARYIIEYPNNRLFYAYFMITSNNTRRGRLPYDRKKLFRSNFIDLGIFVHSYSIYQEEGGFDGALKRLVDWDLVLRYTKYEDPIFIPFPVMNYHDISSDRSRISISEPVDNARIYVRKKHGLPFFISTIIPTYNHEKYIGEAIESVLAQKGTFEHQILICDDGSTDRTREIIKDYKQKYPNIIDISNDQNIGISATFRKCFNHATGDFIAVLEGDDYWSSPNKLQTQMQFILDNMDCSMVFSLINVVNESKTSHQTLKRQSDLTKNKLTGADFLADPSMNLIANFSSCFFKAGLIKQLPSRLFDGRFNEIALAFYLEKLGKIGFIPEILSCYRQHENGVWTGSDKKKQLEGGIAVRQMVKDVADSKFHSAIQKIIDGKILELEQENKR